MRVCDLLNRISEEIGKGNLSLYDHVVTDELGQGDYFEACEFRVDRVYLDGQNYEIRVLVVESDL